MYRFTFYRTHKYIYVWAVWCGLGQQCFLLYEAEIKIPLLRSGENVIFRAEFPSLK